MNKRWRNVLVGYALLGSLAFTGAMWFIYTSIGGELGDLLGWFVFLLYLAAYIFIMAMESRHMNKASL